MKHIPIPTPIVEAFLALETAAETLAYKLTDTTADQLHNGWEANSIFRKDLEGRHDNA